MFSLIYVWINGWVNNGEAGDLRRHLSHYVVTVMFRDISDFAKITASVPESYQFKLVAPQPNYDNTCKIRATSNR